MNTLTVSEFQTKVLDADVVVLKCWAEWCTTCDEILLLVEEFSKTSDVPFYSVNIGEESELKDLLKIKTIPALLFYKNGRLRNFIFGLTTYDEIQRKLNMTKRSK